MDITTLLLAKKYSGGGNSKLPQVVDRTIIELTESDLQGAMSIGENAFQSCSRLTSIAIPSSVKSIGSFAFSGCSRLTGVTIGNSVKSIGSSAFEDCSSLTSITIPDSVTSIGISVFSWCDGLTSVTIGNSVKSIGHYAFADCSSLTSVICYSITPPTISSSTFNDVPATCIIKVPAESVQAYKNATNWSTRADRIQAI